MQINLEDISTFTDFGKYREETRIDNLNESLEKCNNFLEQLKNNEKTEQIAEILLIKSEILLNKDRRLSKFENYLITIEQAESAIEEFIDKNSSDFKKLMGYLYYLKGQYLYEIEKHEESLNALILSLELLETTEDKNMICQTLFALSYLAFWLGQADRGIKYSETALELLSEYENPTLKMDVLFSLSKLHTIKGNYELAIKFSHECTNLAKFLKNEFVYLGSKKIMEAWSNIYIGNYEIAHQMLTDGLEFTREKGDEWWMFFGFNLLSYVQFIIGKGEEALQYALESLNIAKKIKRKTYEAIAYRAVGQGYRNLGNIEKSLECRLKNVELFEFFRSAFHHSLILFEIIEIYVNKNKLEEAEKYLLMLEQIKDNTDLDTVTHRYLASKALIFMKYTEPRERGKAELLFEQLIEEKEIEFYLKVYSLFNLCALLLIEFQLAEDDKILNRLYKYLKKLLDIAETKSLNYIIVEIYILKSKLALINMEIGEAQNTLEKAQKIAEFNKLNVLKTKVVKEQEFLKQKHETWRELIKEEVPFSERTKDVNMDENLNSMRNQITNKLFVLKI